MNIYRILKRLNAIIIIIDKEIHTVAIIQWLRSVISFCPIHIKYTVIIVILYKVIDQNNNNYNNYSYCTLKNINISFFFLELFLKDLNLKKKEIKLKKKGIYTTLHYG